KKIVFAFVMLALLFLNFVNASAQVSDTSAAAPPASTSSSSNDKVREYGLKLGLNWNNPVFSDSKFNSSPNLGYELGLYTRRGAFVWFESGLYFFHLKSSESITDSSGKSDLIYSNIAIPLLVGLRLLGAQKALNLQVFGGANVGYLVDGKFDLLNLSTSDFDHWQFEPTIGIGADVLIITARVTYSYGLTNVLKDYDSHSSYIGLYLGIHL
ncbi:MAG: outer membrane beta-barrel protein, partial [Chitinophagales bacterium]